jgi:hypothetical protein
MMNNKSLVIDAGLVSRLISKQFAKWKNLFGGTVTHKSKNRIAGF